MLFNSSPRHVGLFRTSSHNLFTKYVCVWSQHSPLKKQVQQKWILDPGTKRDQGGTKNDKLVMGEIHITVKKWKQKRHIGVWHLAYIIGNHLGKWHSCWIFQVANGLFWNTRPSVGLKVRCLKFNFLKSVPTCPAKFLTFSGMVFLSAVLSTKCGSRKRDSRWASDTLGGERRVTHDINECSYKITTVVIMLCRVYV